jgi:hypothetical protein
VFVRLVVAIASAGEHSGHVEVADGASELLQRIRRCKDVLPFDLGVAGLMLGVPIELELIFEVEEPSQ